MTDTPTPKYKIGDSFWLTGTETETAQLPCPDCLGTRKWTLTTPAGFTHEVACLRCGTQYRSVSLDNNVPPLTYTKHVAAPRFFTVRSVEVKIPAWHPGEEIRYCNGEHGGQVCYEPQAIDDPDVARSASEATAAIENAKQQATPEALQQKRFSGLQFEIAIEGASWSARYNAWRAYRELADLVEGMQKGEDKDAFEDAIRMVGNLGWAPEIPRIIAALREIEATTRERDSVTHYETRLGQIEDLARAALAEVERFFPKEKTEEPAL